jgi:hypothetical protein
MPERIGSTSNQEEATRVKSAKIVIKVREGAIEWGFGPTRFKRRGTENSAKSTRYSHEFWNSGAESLSASFG